MNNYTLILQEEVSTAIMRSLAKYLKSQGCQIGEEITPGKYLKIQGPDVKTLNTVLQNYIGSASIVKIKSEEN